MRNIKKAKYIIASLVLVFALLFSYTPLIASAENVGWVYLGDISGYELNGIDGPDGLITSADARRALRIAALMDPWPQDAKIIKAADVDKNREITSADARLILRAAAKLYTIKQERNPDIKIGTSQEIINTMREVANKDKNLRNRGFKKSEEGKALSASVDIPGSLKILIGTKEANKMIKEMEEGLLRDGKYKDERDFMKSEDFQLRDIYYHYFPITGKDYAIGSDLNVSALKTIKAVENEDGSFTCTLQFKDEKVGDIHKKNSFNVQHSRVFGEQDYALMKKEFSNQEGMTLKDLYITYKGSYVTYEISPSGRLLSANYYQKWDTVVKVAFLAIYNITMKVTSEIAETYTF